MVTIGVDAAALFLCWLLVSAGLHKIPAANRDYYRGVINDYGFERLARIHGFARLLGAMEITLGVLLVIPAFRGFAGGLAAVLFTGYFVLIARQLLAGKRLMDCGCSGPLKQSQLSAALLWRNGILILLAGLCSFASVGSLLMSQALALILVLAFMMSLVYLCVEQLTVNAQNLTKLSR